MVNHATKNETTKITAVARIWLVRTVNHATKNKMAKLLTGNYLVQLA